jgi:hydroxypyruvate reductase
MPAAAAASMNPRRILLELFDAALRAVDGRESVRIALQARIPGPVAVFAVGKAASAMTLGARDALGDAIESTFVVTKDGHVDPRLTRNSSTTILETAHPVPDARSLAAGEALTCRLRSLPDTVYPLFLVSGGSSSLIDALQDGVTLEDLRALNQGGLHAGWTIEALNAQRQKLSRLKGGGVARMLGSRAATALFVSDVDGDYPDVIGSGLLGGAPGLSDGVVRVVVANVGVAMRRVVDAAASQGLRLEVRAGRFKGEAPGVAREFVDELRATDADGLVWGGESTVKLPVKHGRGGRNTHLALAAARLLKPGEPLTILAAGTDGTDGPTEDAGAIVDSGTVERAELAGVDVERAFREFDSGLALEAAEDLVHTGPTGTNVGDLLIGIRQSAKSLRGLTAARVL